MMHIFMWLFVNDYGSIGFINGLFLVLFGMLLCLPVVLIIVCTIEKITFLQKETKDLFAAFFIVILFAIGLFSGLNNLSKESPETFAFFIPQYGTQSQKETLSICIQDQRKNGLTEEDKKHIAYIIGDIMKECQKKYDELEEEREQELKHRKFLLKNKEILDSLDKMLIE